ncbi:DUF72 domain-containing protein [Tabrizicola sp.]|jgi:uncharacterized protein YecE (DUF72 family)|uniref:DUF72 domain-containing protein n=1 Tax=Tabrizicola sp. TaxID=2005166 RepID=UPI0035B1DBCA
MTGKIRIGVGGWTFEPWRDNFYPAGLRQADELAFAAKALTAIEVNGTYYGTQKPETFAKWARETPDSFVFALKAPRFATARRVLAEGGESITRFLASGLTELGPKLGPINWQLPPTKTFDPADMAAFLDLLPDRLGDHPLRHAIEARHDSFACDEFTTLLRDRGIAAIQAEDSDYPRIDAATASFAYLRIMGTREDELLGYSGGDLDHWAARLRDMARTREVFLFVISGYKAANPAAAQALIKRL